jgi:hypothetical protein
MSASRSTEGVGVDDQKGNSWISQERSCGPLYFSGTACMSLISGTESTNGVESHEMEGLKP